MKEEIRKTYYENGNIETERTFVDGVEHGPAKGWYESGELSFESFKKDGVPHGLVKNILDKIKNYSKKGLLTLAIIVSLVNTISAQSSGSSDNYNNLINFVELADSTTQEDYARAMISLIQDEILLKKLVTGDTTKIQTLEWLLEHYTYIARGRIDFDLEAENPKAYKLNNILNKKLLGDADKLKYHMNRGEKFNWDNYKDPDDPDDEGKPYPSLGE